MNALLILATVLVAGVSTAPRNVGRIVGGDEAVPHEFPWQVSLQWNFIPGVIPRSSHMCGAVIIRKDIILIAGRCVRDPPSLGRYELWAGKHLLDTPEPSEQMVLAKKILIHQEYMGKPMSAPFDIAIIQTDRDLNITKEVQIVALPDADVIPTGDAVISGWGSISWTSSADMPNSLRKAVQPLLDYKKCYELIGDTKPLHECNQCAGPLEGGKASCSGDSGGPLVQIKNSTATVVGIATWGFIPCGEPGHPSVYTRVSYFIKWIQEQIDSLN